MHMYVTTNTITNTCPLIDVECDYLTHWARDEMYTISQTTFLSAFSWIKIYEFRIKFRWSLFLRVQ